LEPVVHNAASALCQKNKLQMMLKMIQTTLLEILLRRRINSQRKLEKILGKPTRGILHKVMISGNDDSHLIDNFQNINTEYMKTS
jgi:hypothetical protein